MRLTGRLSFLTLLLCFSCAWLQSMASATIRLEVGDNFQNVINANPTETNYIIAAGTHRLQSVTPNNGTSFIGENGAILKGSKLLDPTAAVASGSLYYWTGQTQETHSQNAYGVDTSTAGHERETYYGNELFVDGVRYRHVNNLVDVDAAGEWFFDYTADRIYMYGNPAGKTVETSVSIRVFNLAGKSDIRIENLTISHYANSIRPIGPIEAATSNRVILRNLDCSYNHAAGSSFGPNMLVENCRFTYNGQIGIVGGALLGAITDPARLKTPVIFRNNLVAYNNQLYYVNDECGAYKIANSWGSISENNWVHDNRQWGIWYDVHNQGSIIRSNLVEGANSYRGIFYEISGNVDTEPTRIYWNTIKDQLDAGVDISNSANCWVYENAISVAQNLGISARDNGRSPSYEDPNRRFDKYRAWNNDVRVLHATFATPHRVVGSASQVDSITGNTYRGRDNFGYFGTDVNFATWQSHGYDTNGTYSSSTATAPSLPPYAQGFQLSHYGPIPASITGHWRLDESTGTVASDSSGNGNHGTLSGNPTWQPTGGQRQGAIAFDQDDATPNSDYIDCGTAPGSAPALTVAFWMKPTQANRDMIPVGKSSGSSAGSDVSKGWAIKLRNDGDIKFRVGGEYAATDISAGAGTYGTNWIHVAATFGSGTAKLYINGVLRASQSGITTRSVDNTTTPLRLGKNAAGVIEPYDGLLDDVQIYSAALDQPVIQAIMGTPSLKPVADWHLDDAAGTSALDNSGNGNTGTLNNSPLWTTAKQGWGLDFNGTNQSVSVPHSASLNLSSNKVTLMAWVKADAITGYRGVISKTQLAYELNIRDGKPRLELGLSDSSQMRAETTNVEIATGNWYHIAAVRDGSTIKLYVNGVSKPVTYIDTAKTLNLATNSNPVQLGNRQSAALWFDGSIDEVEVHNTALTTSEVQYAMNKF